MKLSMFLLGVLGAVNAQPLPHVGYLGTNWAAPPLPMTPMSAYPGHFPTTYPVHQPMPVPMPMPMPMPFHGPMHGPMPYQEPYMPADEEFGCGFYTWTTMEFQYRRPLPAIPDGSQNWLIRENIQQDHAAFIVNNYECLCDAFSNPVLNVCRQKLLEQEPYYEDPLASHGAHNNAVAGPMPSKMSPFPPPRPDGGLHNCHVKIEIYIPFTSPLPWEKHYDLTYEYERDDYLECVCDVGGAPKMDTCRQMVAEVEVEVPDVIDEEDVERMMRMG